MEINSKNGVGTARNRGIPFGLTEGDLTKGITSTDFQFQTGRDGRSFLPIRFGSLPDFENRVRRFHLRVRGLTGKEEFTGLSVVELLEKLFNELGVSLINERSDSCPFVSLFGNGHNHWDPPLDGDNQRDPQ